MTVKVLLAQVRISSTKGSECQRVGCSSKAQPPSTQKRSCASDQLRDWKNPFRSEASRAGTRMSQGLSLKQLLSPEQSPQSAFHVAPFTSLVPKVRQLCHGTASSAQHRQLNFDKVPDTRRENVNLIKRIAANLTLMSSLNSQTQFFVLHSSISYNPKSQASSGNSKWQNAWLCGPSALNFLHPLSVFVIQKVLFFLFFFLS